MGMFGDLDSYAESRAYEREKRENYGLKCVNEFVRLSNEYGHIADTFLEADRIVSRIKDLQEQINLLQSAINKEKIELHDLRELNYYKKNIQ